METPDLKHGDVVYVRRDLRVHEAVVKKLNGTTIAVHPVDHPAVTWWVKRIDATRTRPAEVPA